MPVNNEGLLAAGMLDEDHRLRVTGAVLDVLREPVSTASG